MKEYIDTLYGTVRKGDTLRILKVSATTTLTKDGIDHQAKLLEGKTGKVDYIDDSGAIHGDWGGLAILPDTDSFEILNHK